MRPNPVGFALTVAMALLVVLMGMTLLSGAGLIGFTANPPVYDVMVNDSTLNPQATPYSNLGYATLDSATTVAVAAGDALFKGNCAQCHALHTKEVGPALAGITDRRPISWLVPWVKNSSKVVASGDPYAVKLYNEYGQQQMPSFNLSDEEIAQVIAYIQNEQNLLTTNTVAQIVVD